MSNNSYTHISFKVSYSVSSSRFTVSLPEKEGRFHVARDFSMEWNDQIANIARNELHLDNFLITKWGEDYFIIRK